MSDSAGMTISRDTGGYELLESLGPAHPTQVSVTVAEATARERRGIPLAISGDPVPVVDTIEHEWLRNNPGQPSPFNPDDQALYALADLERQHARLWAQPLRKDWIPVADKVAAPAPAVDAGAAGSLSKATAQGHVGGTGTATSRAKPADIRSMNRADQLMERKYGPFWWDQKRLRGVSRRLAGVMYERRERWEWPALAVIGGVIGGVLGSCLAAAMTGEGF